MKTTDLSEYVPSDPVANDQRLKRFDSCAVSR